MIRTDAGVSAAAALAGRTRHLEQVTAWTLEALDLVVALGHLQSRLGADRDGGAVVRLTYAHLTRLLPFRTLAFLTVDEAKADFVLADCQPEADRALVQEEVEEQIATGTLGWVLSQSRTVTARARRPGHTVVLHALVAGSRVVGLFVGVVRTDELDLTDAASNLLSLILLNTAQALESASLYERLRAHSRDLEREAREAAEALSRTQAQLGQAQKMDAIGRLAGGIAHDFNNLLTVIRGRTDLLLDHIRSDDPRRRHVDVIQKTAARAAELTRQLLAFSRKQVLQPRVLDLDALVANVGTMLRALLGEQVELAVRPGGGRGGVKADPGQIEQVILNLAVNARDAMPGGGRLTIETAHVTLDEAFARRHPGARPGPYVTLAVRDTGVGMDAATRALVFEPFFTTKGPGKGTGLGLAMVYGIVKQSGGHVTVASEPGQGATFTVYLPRVDEAAARPAEPEAGGVPVPSGSETILLAEDEHDVRDLACEILETSGYTVLQAREGEEALRIAREHPGPIHLLVTDVVMPLMTGRDLADRLAPLRPETRVLYVSGYTDDAIVHHGVLDPGTAFLPKPFTPDVLACKVREVLDGPIDA